MPWRELSAMDAKVRFVGECLRGEEPMTVLCERYGISRETGYVWKRRYLAEGGRGLEERSRAPHHVARATPEGTIERLVELRRDRPHWGARKLLAVLRRRHPAMDWPAASTVTDILRRAGLVDAARRRRRPEPQLQPFGAVERANDTWCIDFKGWFRTQDGERCDPLTVTDAHSRFLLAVRIMPERSDPVRSAMEEVFGEYGLPLAIRSDNGPPFASIGAAGLSVLSVHWAKLGIRLERIVPGHPQQNGRHERMHRTLKAETTRPAERTLLAQQVRFDAFCETFNDKRPHEALGDATPATFYEPSPRRAPKTVPLLRYPLHDLEVRVLRGGKIKPPGLPAFSLSTSLEGQNVGLRELDAARWLVTFASHDLGVYDEPARRFTPKDHDEQRKEEPRKVRMKRAKRRV
jgi:putative transposase